MTNDKSTEKNIKWNHPSLLGEVMLILVMIFIYTFLFTSAKEERNLLQNEAKSINLFEHLATAEDFKPFPKYADSIAWTNLDKELKAKLIREGELALDKEWEILSATDYQAYRTNGNRNIYESKYFGRRGQLSDLVIAEMIEHKGRFTNKIADGIWLICEESNWEIPAHARGKLHYGEKDYYVDLFAAETSSLLAWTYYLMGDELNKISPRFTERIKAECKKRIIAPALTHDDFNWMGFKYKHVNNWNTWITSNWLTTVLILEDDSSIRKQSIEKILVCIDNYVNIQPADGGCEEGPYYWTVAGGRLLQSLDLLKLATNGVFNIFDAPLIKNITAFFYEAHITKNYFVNFGDGPYIFDDGAVKIFHQGKVQNNHQLMNTAKSVAAYYNPLDEIALNKFGDLYGNLVGIFDYEAFKNFQVTAAQNETVWLPDLQLLCTSTIVKKKEIYLSALGAYNGQSHNHNDVGNYIIFVNGEPALIDIGVGVYTAKNKGSSRYDILTMQSAYHNLPTINGVQQKYGRHYKATAVVYKKNKLSMNIASAYPEDAKVSSYIRNFEISKKGISIVDNYSLTEYKEALVLNQITPLTIVKQNNGTLTLYRNSDLVLTVIYNPEQLSFSQEAIKLIDKKLISEWKQDVLYRFQLTAVNKQLTDRIIIRYE